MSELKLLYVAFGTIGLLIVHSTIDSTAHSIPLNSLEHWVRTTPMTYIRPDLDSNPVPLNFEQQPDGMSHLGRPGYNRGFHLDIPYTK